MKTSLACSAWLISLVLAGCGQPGQQAQAPAAHPTSPTPTVGAQAVGSAPVVDDLRAEPISANVVDSAALSGQACSLDTVDGSYATQLKLSTGGSHSFRGWVASHLQQPAGRFEIVLVGTNDFAARANTGVARPDVAASLKNPKLVDAGFEASVDLGSVPAGHYAVRFLMQGNAGSYWCDTKKELVLQASVKDDAQSPVSTGV